MPHNFSLKDYRNRTMLILALIIFGFISSKALISIGTGILLVNFIASVKQHKFAFVKKPLFPILATILFFLATLLSFAFSPDYTLALKELWRKSPWLIIPISVAAMGKLDKNHFNILLTYFILLISVSGIIVLSNYYMNYAFYTEQIAVGKNIPTPLNHIRFSLMAAFAGITSLYFFIQKSAKLTPYDNWFFGICSALIFALLHILSVRSGLICYYLALVFLVLYFTYTFKKWWILPLVSLALIAMPYFAYHNIKSFHNKVDYMAYDLEQLAKNEIGHNSDSRRWRSLQVGWEMVQEKPILGYGLGYGEVATKEFYQIKFPEVETENQKIPHNQFLFTLLETGSIGLIFLLLAIAIPFASTLVFKNPLYTSLAIIIFFSCLVENTFESQLGMTFYLIFGSLLLKSKGSE